MAGTFQIAALHHAGSAGAAEGAGALAILPELILFLTAGAILTLDLIRTRGKEARARPEGWAARTAGSAGGADPLLFTALLGLVSSAASLGAIAAAPAAAAAQFHGTIVTDGLSAGSGILVLLISGVTLVAAESARGGHRGRERDGRGELYVLVLIGSAFLILCVQAAGLLTAFAGVEGLGLTILVLAGLGSGDPRSRRGLVKVFILSESASAVLLLGLVLVLGGTGEASFAAVQARAQAPSAAHEAPLLALGTALVFTALIGKALTLPIAFRWLEYLSDADSLVTTQLGRAMQISLFVLLVRAVLSLGGALDTQALTGVVSTIAAGALVTGAVLMHREVQREVQREGDLSTPPDLVRLLRAVMVFHVGFLLMAALVELAGARSAATAERGVPLLFWLFVTEVPMLGVVSWTASRGPCVPKTALWFAILLFSFAGVPPLPGFWGRLVLFREAVTTGFGFLAFFAAAASIVGIRYALRHAAAALREARSEVALNGSDRAGGADAAPDNGQWVIRLVLAACAIVTLVMGLFPETLLEVCRSWAMG